MRTLEYKIPSEYNEKRVLHFLKASAGLSARLIRTLKMRPDGILLNGEHIRTVDFLHTGDILTINIPKDNSNSPIEKFNSTKGEKLEILYEDEDVIVVNKPATLAIHQSHNHQGDTLANLLSEYLGPQIIFRAVGRLDKGTSGIVVCAKNAFAANKLQGKIEKIYFAMPEGIFTGKGKIEAPIFRPDPIKTYRIVDDRGDVAITCWEELKTGKLSDGTEVSFLRVNLETGRTHQIRVHFSHLGAPLLGDTMYGRGREDISHQALHCGIATFKQPFTEKTITVKASLPKDMQNILDNLEKNTKGL
ncbi:MAG: RluA family pseudouridine synthase [Ruminococcaceae bacterium]|nr:RluA family pseudouridine synthase [Oscillospiraceae bacterium]